MRVSTQKSIQSFFRAEADKLKRKGSALMWETLSIGCYPHTQQEGDRQSKRGSYGMCSKQSRDILSHRCATNMNINIYVYVRTSEGDSVFLWLLPYYLGQALDQHGTQVAKN